jgi:hypothetical protein
MLVLFPPPEEGERKMPLDSKTVLESYHVQLSSIYLGALSSPQPLIHRSTPIPSIRSGDSGGPEGWRKLHSARRAEFQGDKMRSKIHYSPLATRGPTIRSVLFFGGIFCLTRGVASSFSAGAAAACLPYFTPHSMN